MGLFWRRKTGDQFVTLGLNEPERKDATDKTVPSLEKPAAEQPPDGYEQRATPDLSAIEPVATGAGPTPLSTEPAKTEPKGDFPAERSAPAFPSAVTPKPAARQDAVPPRSPFATSVLGLNLSIEELKTNFGTYNPVGEAEAKLKGLRMHESHQAMKYFIKFQQLATCVQWGKAALRRQAYNGLAKHIKDDMVHHEKPNTLSGLWKLVQAIDARYWE